MQLLARCSLTNKHKKREKVLQWVVGAQGFTQLLQDLEVQDPNTPLGSMQKEDPALSKQEEDDKNDLGGRGEGENRE